MQNIQTATKIIRNDKKIDTREINVDICIVGAGISGVSAAIESARLGRKVAIIDALPTLGGQAVNSLVGAFCGLFSNGPDPYQFTYGIADEILRYLGEAEALHYRIGDWTSVLYDEITLSRWIEKKLYEENINLILDSTMRGVRREGRRIKAIDLTTRLGDLVVKAESFVDASGNAMLAWQAGLSCRKPEDGRIYGTQAAIMEGVNNDKQPSREVMYERLQDKADLYGITRKDGYAYGFPGKGLALLNMTRVETPLDSLELPKKSIEGKEQVDKVVVFLRKEFPEAFENAKIRTYGHLGIRQTRWIVGCQHLTVDDVRNGTRFPDAVARTAWAIELHDKLENTTMESFDEDHVHYVPLGSLIPPDTDNLMAVGRCIDADIAALASVRVMGPCIAMGAAAAHALDLAQSGSVHDIDIESLQERIQDNLVRKDKIS